MNFRKIFSVLIFNELYFIFLMTLNRVKLGLAIILTNSFYEENLPPPSPPPKNKKITNTNHAFIVKT